MTRAPHPPRKRKETARRAEPGAVPGTLSVNPDEHGTVIRCHSYGPDEMVSEVVEDPDQLGALVEKWPVTWIDVDGLGDVEKLEKLADVVGLHRLALADVVNVNQRPKVEPYGEQLFIVVRMVSYDGCIETEQLSIFAGKNFVITFQGERPGDSLNPVRERLRQGHGRIRGSGADYLTYALVDAVVDEYFPVLEHHAEVVEAVEDEAFSTPSRGTPERIQDVKGDLLALRRAAVPLRDAAAALVRNDKRFFTDETVMYLRDCHDHTNQALDAIELNREIVSGLLDVYLSSMSNRMNDVMKILTIMATIFIPLTFIAGVYGMNFDTRVSAWNMPELAWPHGYPLVLGLMASIALLLVGYFYRKGWLSRPE